MDKKKLIEVRKKYIESIKCEMLGPGSESSYPNAEHEIITENPEIRYSLGILYPKDETIEYIEKDENIIVEENPDEQIAALAPEEQPKEEISFISENNDEENDNLDEEVALSSQNKPSSMGIIFFIKGSPNKIKLNLKFASYSKTEIENCCIYFKRPNNEKIEIPEEISNYIEYDDNKNIFKPNLQYKEECKAKFTKKYLKELYESNVFEFYDYLYEPLNRLASQISNSFIRKPHNIDLKIVFSNDYSDMCNKIDGSFLKITSIKRKIKDNLYAITLMLVNDVDKSYNQYEYKYIFQPQITIYSSENEFLFCDYNNDIDVSKLSLEEQSIAMQYRNKKNYATGMGVSVNYEIDYDGKGYIETDYFPRYEVPQMDFSINQKYEVSKNAFSMKFLSDLDSTTKDEKIKALESVVLAYENWIKDLKELQKEDYELLHGKYSRAATKNIENCLLSLERMKQGIKTLKNNDVAWESFELANRAMFMQRAHLKIQEKFKDDNELNEDEISAFLENINYYDIDSKIKDLYSWRPFQIAFLLMSIVSIVYDDNEDRNLVDLIWFPTGGGKTEAYLGLTAFTIFHRKLKYQNESNGTSVIMRYTLRLLTAQQFTRASTLICACEYIRKDSTSKKPKYKSYPLGNEKIKIGLWIGGEHTPNSIVDAKRNLNKLTDNVKPNNLKSKLEKYNKFQVLKCPWCGKSMVKKVIDNEVRGEWGYQCSNNHFKLVCPREGCHFNYEGELPIQIVDEELYKDPPTLLFGTVDKFAMIAWNPKIGRFFGVDTKNRTPELIIQDELHLISGPLGTMVGAYETVIDTLCKSKGNSTKIIASTATIRGAEEQCSALYDRKVYQFPSPGINVEDSFFARESSIDYDNEKYGRIYVGVMGSGKTKAMIEDRIISSLMERINMMKLEDEVKDKFWTLTAYFNSLKELGKCSTLVEDDVIEFIGRMASRYGLWGNGRKITKPDELTSRITTTDLNETLDKLEKTEFKSGKDCPKPSDIVLATNMISVGIDISRLNVMLIVGQPKLTSEYIQASSRIGREYPGVVFVLYDSSRSRDRSHYEQFIQYHSSFYKFVEPTGITPFSEPSRNRTLSSVMIALMRNLESELKNEENAGKFDINIYKDRIEELKNIVIQRNKNINSRLKLQLIDDSEEIENEIQIIFDKWETWSKMYKNDLIYGEKAIVNNVLPEGKARLLASHGTSQNNYAFESMTSMRNVDTQLRGKVLIYEDDYE